MTREERFGIGRRIDSLLLDLLECLRIATYTHVSEKPLVLARAINTTDSIRFFVQVTREAKLISNKHFEELGLQIEAIGKMIGGWRKGILAKTPPQGGEREE